MIYAIPLQEDAHALLKFLFGEIPEYKETDSIMPDYMLFDPTDSKRSRIVNFYELYNEAGTMYTIDDLSIIHM